MSRAFTLLYRHFLKEYFFIQTASGHRDSSLSVSHVFAFLFVPGIFLSAFSLMKTGPLLDKPPADFIISALDDRLVFIVFAMVVAGLSSVLNLHKLLPNQRETNTLSTLPISAGVLVAARLLAYFSFVLLICADASLVSCFIYPLSAAPWDSSFSMVAQLFFAHVLTITLCTMFTIGIMSGLYAVCRYIAPSALALFNLLAVAACIAFLFAGPISLRSFVNWPSLARANPALWFLGFYEMRLPRISPDVEIQGKRLMFDFAGLSRHASVTTSLVLVAGLAALAYVCYLADTDALPNLRKRPFLRGRLLSQAMLLIPSGVARAAAMTYWAALGRVHECRLALAVSLGTSCGVIANELVASDEGSRSFFIAPFVLTFFLVTGLAAIIRLPVHLDAKWVLEISPCLVAKEVRRGVNLSIALFALLPLLLLLLLPYGRMIGLGDGISLLSATGLAALILLELVTWNVSSFPFSYQRTTPQHALPLIFVCFCLALTAYGFVLGTASESLLRSHKMGYANVLMLVVWIAVRKAFSGLHPNVQVSFSEVDEDQVQLLNLDYPSSSKAKST